MSPLDLFIRELDERKGKIPCCQEVTEIQTSVNVENVLKDLLLEVEKENPFFKTTLINSGSFYEGTKVGEPDEFDYFVQLDYFSEPEAVRITELPRSSVMVTPSELGFRKLSELTPSKYRQLKKEDQFHWKTWIKAPFVEIFDSKAKGFEAYGMEVCTHAGQMLGRHGPAYCLVLKWTSGERYRGLMISVDLSLAVKINSRSTMSVDLETPTGEVIRSCLDSLPYYFAVSAYRDREFEVDGFRLRCSQSCLEQALFSHFGPDSGPSVCLRVLKVLRDISYPGKNIVKDILADCLNSTDLGMFDVFCNLLIFLSKDEPCSKWISSYAFKTLVLFEWQQNLADECWTGCNLSERLLNILNNLRLCLKQGQGLRSFFYNDYNVLPNADKYTFRRDAANRITVLQNCMLSMRNENRYRFKDCLKNILKEVKLTCQKLKLTLFLNYGLVHHCDNAFAEFITRVAKPTDFLLISSSKSIFCYIYIEALLGKIAPDEKLILTVTSSREEFERSKELKVSLEKAVELFKDIARTRMTGFDILPSNSLCSLAVKSADTKRAKLLEALCNTFKKDIVTLEKKLEQS